jgi:hypothetical protein
LISRCFFAGAAALAGLEEVGMGLGLAISQVWQKGARR